MKESSLKNSNPWMTAIRPKTLPAGAGPVILGLSLAYQQEPQSFSFFTALVTMACAVLLQISSNLINDYYDGVEGLDDENRLGPPRATSLGLIPAPAVKKGFLFTLGLSFILGLYLMKLGGLPIVLIGLSSLFFSWAYTGGPFPLSYFGLGEAFAFIFFGPVAVWGTWFLQTLQLTGEASTKTLLWGSTVGLLSAALMGVNNLRDRYTDKSKGKTTLATLLGGHTMRKLIFLFILVSQIIAQVMLYFKDHHHLYHLIGVTPLFFFSKQWWSLLRDSEGRALNITLATVGKYIFLYSLAYSAVILFL